MNTKQVQFNRQKVAALLLAGSILAATVVSLTWVDVSVNQANREIGPAKAGSAEYDSELSSEFPLGSGKAEEGQLLAGGRGGISGDF